MLLADSVPGESSGRIMRSEKLPCLLVLLTLTALPASGSIIYDVPSGITAPPADDRGWQYVGSWQVGGGVAVAPNYFLTAQHLGGGVGGSFVLNGVFYTTVSLHDIQGTDLRLMQIAGAFPHYAPLYDRAPGSEKGQSVSLIGFGHYTQGDPLITNGVQNGWYWGAPVGKNFAMNNVADVLTLDGAQHLAFNFQPVSNQNQGVYTGGDSGGGLFIYSGGAWRLAGIAHSITGFYQNPGDANFLQAAIYNPAGLYVTDAMGNFMPATGPQQGFATEVAAYFPQLDQVLLPGDLNYDGSVGFDDLLILARHYGQTGATYEQGDVNGDGTVDFADLVTLARDYGQSLDGAPSAGGGTGGIETSAISMVPEPHTQGLLALAVIATLPRRRKCMLGGTSGSKESAFA